MDKLKFYLDAAIYPLLIGWMLARTSITPEWFGLALLGFVLFTFLEYWIHRTVLHRWFYQKSHARHHDHPEEYTFIAGVPFLFLTLYFILPAGLFVGFTIAYIWFYSWHHLLHHIDLQDHPHIKRYARWHLMHHKYIRCNFGITSPVWDRVFGTYRASLPTRT